MSNELEKLERFERLHASGGLTDAEFATEKRRLLNPGYVDPKLWSGPGWRSVAIFCAALFVIGALVICILLLMPAPTRDADTANMADAASGSDAAIAPWPVPAPEADMSTVPSDSTATDSETTESEYVEPTPVRGRCLLQVNGKTYIDGECDIFLGSDGSFDVQDRADNLTYFAKVLRDGTSARGYWNEEPGATHAHTDLGDLKRDGACWKNDKARICAWR